MRVYLVVCSGCSIRIMINLTRFMGYDRDTVDFYLEDLEDYEYWCSAVKRATLHDFVVEYIRVLAEVFGWRVSMAPRSKKGPDVVIEHVLGNKVSAVLIVESEVGHDTGSASKYFEKLCQRDGIIIKKNLDEGVENTGIVIITNAPRRLSDHLNKHEKELCERLNLSRNNECILREGLNFFIIPAVMFKEVIPAVIIRFMSKPEHIIKEQQ